MGETPLLTQQCLAGDQCGTSQYEDAGTCDTEGSSCATGRIVNGIDARRYELPYQVRDTRLSS